MALHVTTNISDQGSAIEWRKTTSELYYVNYYSALSFTMWYFYLLCQKLLGAQEGQGLREMRVTDIIEVHVRQNIFKYLGNEWKIEKQLF